MDIWFWLIFILVVLLWLIGIVVLLLGVPPKPSRQSELDQFFVLAKIRPGERVFDLGAGDGRVLQITRDKYGAQISGWELHPLIWLMAKCRLGKDSDIRLASLWGARVEEADVVFVFLMPMFMSKVQKIIWAKLKPGARLVSNSFPMLQEKPTESCGGVYLYVKPLLSGVRPMSR